MKTAFEIPEFQEARRVRMNSSQNVQVGAVITRDNKILSCACNGRGSRTFRAPGYHSITLPKHAEFMAISYINPEDIKGTTVWVWRETKDGVPTLARPCERHCMPFLKAVGVERVVYTTSEDPYFFTEEII